STATRHSDDRLAETAATLPPPSEATGRAPAAGQFDATLAQAHEQTRSQQHSTPGGGLPAPAAEPLGERTLGGYRLLRELGRGAMGAVYLARQLSLDRNVALKVIQEDLAQDPRFIARFTREAYAAAQLTHHNVVQIYDLGAERKTHFFSMELVDGESLGDLSRRHGPLEPRQAASYALQAARGLHYAHQLGMVHRDVKPGNLLLNQLGVVKVADLGLVKTRGGHDGDETTGERRELQKVQDSHTTLRNVAMGTPAFMAPEQAESAADVDHRADIYSLGCTLYVLLTGRPPFDGATAAEVITKHKTEPVVRPDVLVRDVPGKLSEIVLRMVAKRPEQRYGDLDEVIRDLQGFLGVGQEASFAPSRDDVQRLERCVAQFNQSPTARLRAVLWPAFWGLCALVGLACLLLGQWSLVLAAAGAAVLAPLAYILLSGMLQRSYELGKIRELVFSSSWSDYALWLIGGLLLLVAIVALQLIPAAVIAVLLAAGFAAVMALMVDRRVASERRGAVAELNELLKTARLGGADEDGLRRFVAQHAGDRWEELFEQMFGYEAKLEARQQWSRGADGKSRRRHGVWRDWLVCWIDARVQSRREARQCKHLRQVAQAELQADGLSADDARREAEARAEALVQQAAQLHATLAAAALEQNPQVAAARRRERVKAMLDEARGGPSGKAAGGSRKTGVLGSLLWLPISGKVRFLVGAVLLVACALWLQKNGALANGLRGWLDLLRTDAAGLQPLELPLVPAVLTGLFGTLNAGAAGLILLLSAVLCRGYRGALLAVAAAAIMVLGPVLGVPALAGFSSQSVSLAAGLVLCVPGVLLGVLFGRRAASD
ncbi:MAG: serine/threonine protein kinase, partial [Pirellulaceae bacterium]|nr:serine/threonine protein kinase [Pirellulaceae bacterium]